MISDNDYDDYTNNLYKLSLRSSPPSRHDGDATWKRPCKRVPWQCSRCGASHCYGIDSHSCGQFFYALQMICWTYQRTDKRNRSTALHAVLVGEQHITDGESYPSCVSCFYIQHIWWQIMDTYNWKRNAPLSCCGTFRGVGLPTTSLKTTRGVATKTSPPVHGFRARVRTYERACMRTCVHVSVCTMA